MSQYEAEEEETLYSSGPAGTSILGIQRFLKSLEDWCALRTQLDIGDWLLYNRDMTKKQLDYIELKTGSRQKRITRVEWLDAQLSKFEKERKDLLKSIHRDYLSIEKMKSLRDRKAVLAARIPEMERSVRNLTGDKAGTALEELMEAKDELMAIDEDMRLAYYAKEIN